MIRRIAVAATIGLLLSSQAMAGEVRLAGVQGSVLVNQNGRFVPVTASTKLKAGDRVMAMDGSASVTYADGCKVSVGSRSMATVGAASPCASGSSGVVRAAAADGYDDNKKGYIWDDSTGLWLWVGFGVVTVAVVGSALSDDETPSSP
ncbi:hypothetical protein QO010_002715 [Caulobacter ginsengisoli]|uniref:Uncharacterized protein n=1 Tax=Caulobacter ginsengisoli TaxID=400775 RepID=A0ABU0ISF4_9CAUL|nr:hypothetical protein [Caulobacter ginsengisoli]MDQ0464931.1 hypothetical protein [Caulobacter ginsengisoli]